MTYLNLNHPCKNSEELFRFVNALVSITVAKKYREFFESDYNSNFKVNASFCGILGTSKRGCVA